MSRDSSATKPEAKKDWSKPTAIDQVTLIFPANIIGTLLPLWDEIPVEFKDNTDKSRKWRQLQSDWFFYGLKNPDGLVTKPDVDKFLAMRHLSACQCSFQPKHEHKQAGVAYLLSLWFEDSTTWERGTPSKEI